jgi:hypothetical protein
MKYIKSFNEGFFDIFKKKDSEEDKIINNFIKRLEKVKDTNPYSIKKIDEIKDDIGHSKAYRIFFDDTTITIGYIKWKYATKYNNYNKNDYRFYVGNIGESEVINCQDKYKKILFELTDKIFIEDNYRKKINKINSDINPAADLL